MRILDEADNAKPTLCEVTGLVGAEADYVGVYTNAGQVATLVFRNAAGKEVAVLHESASP